MEIYSTISDGKSKVFSSSGISQKCPRPVQDAPSSCLYALLPTSLGCGPLWRSQDLKTVSKDDKKV